MRLQLTNIRSWAAAQASFLQYVMWYVRERGVEEEGRQNLEQSLGHLWHNSVFLFVVLKTVDRK